MLISLKNKRHRLITKKIQTYVRAAYKKIESEEFVLGEAVYNYKCHINSVQKVKEGSAAKVILCYAIDKDSDFSCVHFINQLEDGSYQDNTWGWVNYTYDYYFIREVSPSEYDTIWSTLTYAQRMLFRMYSTWFDTKILGISDNQF